MVLSSSTHTATAVYGTDYELSVIAAVVVRGTSLFGGRGSVLRSARCSSASSTRAEGLVIVFAVAFDQYQHREG